MDSELIDSATCFGEKCTEDPRIIDLRNTSEFLVQQQEDCKTTKTLPNRSRSYDTASICLALSSAISNAYNVLENSNNLENSSSGTEKIKNGYKFAANLDMSKFKVIDLKEYIDYNYYDLDTTAKYIKYDMVAKGFDCE